MVWRRRSYSVTHARVVALFATAAAVLPAAASADPPWNPAAVEGVSSTTTLLTTQIGGRILIGTSNVRSLASPTVVARVQADGSTPRRQTLPIAYARAAAYERAGIAVAGSRPAMTSAAAAKAPVLVALGSIRGIHGIGTPHALAGSEGQWVLAVGGNAGGTMVAVLTGSMYSAGAPSRTLWLRDGKSFRRALTLHPGTNAREAAVAVGPRGDVLLVWQARRGIYARHLDGGGHPGPMQRLGSGVQSALQARIDDDGRLEVAWESQRVSEGFAATAATVSYTTAPRAGRFAAPRVVGGSSLTGSGRYVMRPGVRLVATGPNTSMLAWTDYDGSHFGVKAADVQTGTVHKSQTVSPPAEDAVLGDLASAPAGGELVAWLTGTRGTGASGPQRVAAATRPPGATAFSAPQLVSPPGTAADGASVPFAPSAAVDSRSGSSLIAWTTISQQTNIARSPPH